MISGTKIGKKRQNYPFYYNKPLRKEGERNICLYDILTKKEILLPCNKRNEYENKKI